MSKKKSKPTCIDLFSGAGGLTHGLELAGFKTILGVEMDSDCCKTYRKAFPEAGVWNKPIQKCDFTPYRGKVDLVAGGPPCQPFSSGGKRLAAADPRDMIPQFIRAVEEIQPKAFLMENVGSLFGSSHGGYFDGVVTKLRSLGYRVTHKVLSAADYGVPQMRQRGFLVGLKNGRKFTFPKKTHGKGSGKRHITAGKILTHDPVGTPNTAKVTYAKNPDLRPSPYDGLMFNGGGRPINLSQPCRTILASCGGNKTPWIDRLGLVPAYHKYLIDGGSPRSGILEGARRLTVEECAMIQTFPADFPFQGRKSSKYRQVGNAVPALLAQAVGSALFRRLG